MEKLELAKGVRMRKEDFGMLVFNPKTFFVVTINGSGKKILNLCNGLWSLQDILSFISPQNKNTLNPVEIFIRNLISAGIIERITHNE